MNEEKKNTQEPSVEELIASARKRAKAAGTVKAAETPKTEEPAKEEPVKAEPVKNEEPDGKEPVKEMPKAEEPVKETPKAEEPAEETQEQDASRRKVLSLVKENKKKKNTAAPKAPDRPEEGIRGYSMNRYYGYMKSRKRKPKNIGFVSKLLIFAAVFLVIAAVLTAACWFLVRNGTRNSAESTIRSLVQTSDREDWRQYLRNNYPENAPAYSRPTDVAYKVLSPSFNVGKVTYYSGKTEKGSVYSLFSDGRHFADVYFAADGSWFSRNETQERVDFDLDFFADIRFPGAAVYVPDGAVLTVNGTVIGAAEEPLRSSAVYPGISPGERPGTVLCSLYRFDSVYFVPELSAVLNGQELVLHGDDDTRTYWFEYPAEMTHTIQVTVPAEVDAYVGESLLTEEWAEKVLIDGELGSLDDGGTGTLPKLAVWTVSGLFAETDVRAEYEEKALTLLSSENNAYVFETPAECKYTVTVLCPAGCEVTVNGKAASAKPTAAAAADLAGGKTSYGVFDAAELDNVAGAVPAFEKTVLTGYLARPNVEVRSGSVVLQPVGENAAGYRISVEYDIASSAVKTANTGAVSAARTFYTAYAEYISEGGHADAPTDRANVDANLDALLAMTADGSSAYFRLMESYPKVSVMHPYGSFYAPAPAVSEVFVYSDTCVCFTLTGKVSRADAAASSEKDPDSEFEDEDEDEPAENPAQTHPDNKVTLQMHFLLVKRDGTWTVWGYAADTAE